MRVTRINRNLFAYRRRKRVHFFFFFYWIERFEKFSFLFFFNFFQVPRGMYDSKKWLPANQLSLLSRQKTTRVSVRPSYSIFFKQKRNSNVTYYQFYMCIIGILQYTLIKAKYLTRFNNLKKILTCASLKRISSRQDFLSLNCVLTCGRFYFLTLLSFKADSLGKTVWDTYYQLIIFMNIIIDNVLHYYYCFFIFNINFYTR